MENYEHLVGKTFTFDDGHYIEVLQVRLRDYNGEPTIMVTFNTYQGGPMLRKSVMILGEFISTFGHLFEK